MAFFLAVWISKVFSRLRKHTADRTDNRIRIMHEIVGGIKVIKMYGWEHAFSELVKEARK